MQVIRRQLTILGVVLLMALPAAAERPRPLAIAFDALRSGNWDNAARVAARDGAVAADIVEWARLRDGRGSAAEVAAFLKRRPDWPGERYLRRQSEEAIARSGTAGIAAFFSETPPQTPTGVLAFADTRNEAGAPEEARALVINAWRNFPMSPDEQSTFQARYAGYLRGHHDARLDSMLWKGAYSNARRMFPLASDAAVAVAKARIALREGEKGVDGLIAAIPDTHAEDGGLQYDRFIWRSRKGRTADAKTLLRATSVSAEALGRPGEWANRRRSLARDEMRDGDPELAYELASRHFLKAGSDYADLEWLSGFIALRKLSEPETALRHFENHNAAVKSPISKGRAGYWRGRALEAMGNVAGADQAYLDAAQYQTSFYGLLAAERAGIGFDMDLAGETASGDWRNSILTNNDVFQAGLLLQASGELSLAERFWTHLTESLDRNDAGLLAQAALDLGEPHLAVTIGKRAARQAIVIPGGYYPLHPVARQDLPMAPEMTLAIARRESEFDPSVQSGVGARGLMQIMPATGREVARRLGRLSQHSTERMISDPAYNAELGATYLSVMAGRFRGNIVMMSAAYNAGPSRPDRWMQIYGDPRRGTVDVVDWIEHIPFRETRNYVMRVAESLPVYRAMLGKEPMPVSFTEELTGSTLLSFAPKGE
ncbi:lytic transglycosylase domain-containing protein [uncultured Roseobacter sp.]|uniref:lytic transglycosylase domain-containing protein n=1 Tax=uncultured Roseobacter sp. TaxID=114847 RepID=UPI0026126413|nr:lytic transglycosylase domain-containing protein [uncultured Roseobacter sp.]